MNIRKNVGGLDRSLRIIGGLAIILAWVILLRRDSLILGIGLGLVSLGLVGFCPFYVPFGISTRKRTD